MTSPGLVACLLIASGLAAWVSFGAGEAAMSAPPGLSRLAALLVMWTAMMAAMMLPSAIPAIRIHWAMQARLGGAAGARQRGLAFVLAWFGPWAAFSLAAALIQPALDARGLTDPMLRLLSPALAAGLMIFAGIWQLLPVKTRCLTHCRTPFDLFARSWRPGPAGALAMGWRYGLYCLGCCWVLMLLLFAGGAMEPLVILALAAFVAAERLLPGGPALARFSGLVLIAAGLLLAVVQVQPG